MRPTKATKLYTKRPLFAGLMPRRRAGTRTATRSGQTMIFLVMILIILLFVVLWNVDLHKIVYVKFLSQNAGDAAAMAAAQWQGTALNLIGDLNIVQAIALTAMSSSDENTDVLAAINELQARLCYVGPMMGLMQAQQAAKNNRIHNNAEFTAYLMNHAGVIRNDYPDFIAEAYPGCLEEYATMLEAICNSGVAAGPDNMQLYTDFLGAHTLLSRDFYDAVATRAWCWFLFNANDLLHDYTDYLDWPPMDRMANPDPINSEFFGLSLSRRSFRLDDRAILALMDDIRGIRNLDNSPVDTQPTDITPVWYCYGERWNHPFAMADDGFPAVGDVKDQYNYAGADSAIRIEASPALRTPGTEIGDITWTAAAKPLGYLRENERPTECNVVLPAFHHARLIPVDASSASAGGSFDLGFRAHCERHLPGYLDAGIGAIERSCWYCRQLLTWENPNYRAQGIRWLRSNSRLCHVGGGPGGGDSGGSRRGH